MKTFAVIGLGRFGSAIALELSALGHEVMAVDINEEKVQQVADKVTHAVTADARKLEVLQALGLRNFDCAVVAMGGNGQRQQRQGQDEEPYFFELHHGRPPENKDSILIIAQRPPSGKRFHVQKSFKLLSASFKFFRLY